MNNLKIGNKGEEIAANFLLSKQFIILEKKFRYAHYEIDLIAKLNNLIVFVEVKTRTSNKFGEPIESITPKKLEKIKIAAVEYLFQNKLENFKIRFDFIGIHLNAKDLNDFSIQYVEDLF